MSRDLPEKTRPRTTRPGSSKPALIWRLMAGERLRYGAALLALLIGSCVLYLAPLVPQVVLDGVLAPHPERASSLVRGIMELAGGREFLRERLWLPAAALVLLSAAVGLLTYLRGRWSAQASERIARRLRDRLYDHLQRLPCAWHDRAATGDTVQRCTSDVETFRQFLASQVVEIGRAAVLMTVPIPLMLAIDARMTLVSLLIVPPVILFAFFFMRRVRAAFQRTDEAEGRLTSCLQENLTGIRVVRAFARQEHEKDRFDAVNRRHRDLDKRLYLLMAWFWSSSDLLCMAQFSAVLAVGGYRLAQGTLQAGEFLYFLTAVNSFIWPVRMMGRILTETGKALVAIGRIGEILEQEPETAPAAPVRLPRASAEGRPEDPPAAEARSSEILFEGVTFRHHGGALALDGVNLRIAPGETVALLGPSGAGKSTLIRLLLRFYDPQEGRVLVDGVDIARVDRSDLRSRISVVMQEPFLYSKTVEENIGLGRRGARPDEIVAAAAAACVHGAIGEFDQGYGTMVGERGVTLSGGQRQRVALARALLKPAPILLLDDALSAVDTDTESEILDALRRLRGSRTTILIAHRLTTLMHADRIVVMNAGRVVQVGSHAELLREEGLYRRLWERQSALESGFERGDEAAEDRPAADALPAAG